MLLLFEREVGAAVTGEILSEYETFSARYLYVAVEEANIDYDTTVARIAEVRPTYANQCHFDTFGGGGDRV